MAESTIVKTKCDGTLTLGNGTISYIVAFEAGNFVLNIPGRTVNNYLDRGKIPATPSLRYGDDQAMTFTFDANLRDLSDGTDVVLPDFLLDPDGDLSTAVGAAASSLGANAEVKTWTMTWAVEGTDHGDTADHGCVLSHCTLSGSISEGDPSTISVQGTSWHAYPTSLT